MGDTTRAIMARRKTFTPELLANVRRRFEHTDEPLSTMAADLDCCTTTLRAIANREGWRRFERPPRDLTPAARLLERAETLVEQSEAGGGLALTAASPQAAQQFAASAEALHAEVDQRIAEFKALRAQLDGKPQGLLDQERAARTLANLTATLHRLQPLRCTGAISGSTYDYDDIPADLDEFREALARRIDAFVASRTNPDDAGGEEPARTAAAE